MVAEIIHSHLQDKEELTKLLAVYDGKPAIFYGRIPEDEDDLWGGSSYARIILREMIGADGQMETTGSIGVDVICKKDSTTPDAIVSKVKKYLHGSYFTTEDQTLSVSWEGVTPYEAGVNDVGIYGITVNFQVIGYPYQASNKVVGTVNDWLRSQIPNSVILGKDQHESIFKLEPDYPVLYSRISQVLPAKRISTSSVTWKDPEVVIHVMASTYEKRLTLIEKLTAYLLEKEKILFADGSYLYIDDVTVLLKANPFKEGQITLKTSYGILSSEEESPKLNNTMIREV